MELDYNFLLDLWRETDLVQLIPLVQSEEQRPQSQHLPIYLSVYLSIYPSLVSTSSCNISISLSSKQVSVGKIPHLQQQSFFLPIQDLVELPAYLSIYLSRTRACVSQVVVWLTSVLLALPWPFSPPPNSIWTSCPPPISRNTIIISLLFKKYFFFFLLFLVLGIPPPPPAYVHAFANMGLKVLKYNTNSQSIFISQIYCFKCS